MITHQDHLVCIEPSRCYRSRDICHSDTRDSLHNSRGWHIANSARWLQHLGSQMALLHKIVIDLDNLCPMTCGPLISWYASPNDLDVSGLVKLLWSRNTPLDISFSRGDDGLSDYPDRQRLRARTFQLDNKFQCNATELTKSLQSLLQKDSNIRKYACLIGSVYLRRCGHFAVICYKTNGATCMVRHNQSTYHTCADTLTVLWRDGSEWNECCKPRTLLGLPQCLKRRIFSEVIGPKTHIEIDVNKPWSHLGPAAGLRLVNRESMALFNEIYWVGKSFHLRCTLEGSQTSFEFQALRRWLGSNGDPHTIEGLLVGAKSSRITRALQITLVFHVWEYVYIEEVRMSIMPLILATAHLPNKFEHGEEIEVKFCVERKGGAIERTLSLPRLRSRVYIALYNIFKRATYPSLILNRPCPEILVDGWGKVVEYVAYGSKPTSYIRNPDEEDRHGPAHKRFSKALREIGLGDSFPYEGYMKSFVRYLEMALREDKPQEAAEKCKCVTLLFLLCILIHHRPQVWLT